MYAIEIQDISKIAKHFNRLTVFLSAVSRKIRLLLEIETRVCILHACVQLCMHKVPARI